MKSQKENSESSLRKNILYLFYQFAEWCGVVVFGGLILFFLYSFFHSIILFYNESNEDLLVKNLLSCFEFLFLAPIPLFIISSSRKIFTGNLPSILEKSITEPLARKLFISSFIALTSIILINSFFDQIKSHNTQASASSTLTEAAVKSVPSLVMIVFILVLILFYRSLTIEEYQNKEKNGSSQ